MRNKKIFYIATAFVLLLMVFDSPLFSQSKAIATRVLVRVVSRDAKIIGTKVGGARITIKDVSTGKVLDAGMHMGSTGSTDLIIKEPHKRGGKVYDTEGAASYVATLMLDKPTVVEITAVGPLGTPQSTRTTSKTLLVVPGKDILGEGVLLEIHGFTVAFLTPEGDLQKKTGEEIDVRVTVTMT